MEDIEKVKTWEAENLARIETKTRARTETGRVVTLKRTRKVKTHS